MAPTGESISAVDEIVLFNADRKPELVRLKYEKMSQNAFAFFRGTDHLFAQRFASFRPRDLGPGILTCGDLHLENFGAYRTDAGDFLFDINDFDEALVAPASFDLVRGTASILLAADLWSIPASQASAIALDFLEAYRQAISQAVSAGKAGEISLERCEGPIRDLLDQTASGTAAALLAQHTELAHHGQRRIIRSEDKHPDVSDEKARQISEAIEQFGATTSTPQAFKVLDVTGRIMGVGSLGLRRYTVLVAGGGTSDTNQLLDVKEAAPCSVLACSDFPQPDTGGNDAVRIVRAYRQLQSKPPAGLAALDINARHFRLREMVPDENRSKLDRLQKDSVKLRAAVGVAGQLTAWSQYRGCGAGAPGTTQALAAWAQGPALDAVLTSAARAVDITCQDFTEFQQAHADHSFMKLRH